MDLKNKGKGHLLRVLTGTVFKDLRVRLVHMWSRTEVGFM